MDERDPDLPATGSRVYTPAEVADIAEEQFKAGLARGRSEATQERKRILEHLHAMVGTFDYDNPMYRKAVNEILDVATDA